MLNQHKKGLKKAFFHLIMVLDLPILLPLPPD
jgi:hypothetical protein